MGVYDFKSLNYHAGHDIVVVRYGDNEMTFNVAVECNDCNEVLLDYDNPDASFIPLSDDVKNMLFGDEGE